MLCVWLFIPSLHGALPKTKPRSKKVRQQQIDNLNPDQKLAQYENWALEEAKQLQILTNGKPIDQDENIVWQDIFFNILTGKYHNWLNSTNIELACDQTKVLLNPLQELVPLHLSNLLIDLAMRQGFIKEAVPVCINILGGENEILRKKGILLMS